MAGAGGATARTDPAAIKVEYVDVVAGADEQVVCVQIRVLYAARSFLVNNDPKPTAELLAVIQGASLRAMWLTWSAEVPVANTLARAGRTRRSPQGEDAVDKPKALPLCVGRCPGGGIGRRAGLKHLWETVPVRLRLRVQKPLRKKGLFLFYPFF